MANENKALVSLSIAARMTLNVHSLNNEGGEGNQIQTRMVDIVGEDNVLHNVNAISGDMLKHVLMEHYYRRAKEDQVNLCASCQRLNVNRINGDDAFLKETKGIRDADFIDQMLQRCAMDDIGGILVTEEKRSVPRKSICEFGWVVALPEISRTESYFHVKYVSERGEKQRNEDANDQEKTGANRGQNIFYRPASSGVYAFVCHLELGRIGYNDITQQYAIKDEKERQKRAALLLESVMYSFLELNGAMRSTQLPHLVALEGFISTSSSAIPAPLISPLVGGSEQRFAYREQAQEIATALNGKNSGPVQLHNFDTLGQFAQQMRTLIDTSTPQALTF
ncbi:CRISPR-associated protein DevR [Ktedonobacter sp. SOSP1-85]|uniref:DevR family CRISPR-associated autoregulator n=1 Tax=Ktedonobacter sp. SOSP1-85 TaxID=2778367 RepID=UPI00191668C2|nr:DevR family CRISPR-associated autoregulator [Ktedonobacter sp. SOSP1-85]GHO77465.1 CRISPR-associated protein DevR [Ktedonobacter sp. SOSP1-85]